MPYAPNIVFRMRWMVGIALLAIAAAVPAALTGSRAAVSTDDAPVVAAQPLPSLNPALAAQAGRGHRAAQPGDDPRRRGAARPRAGGQGHA